ncbi:MAG: TIGR00282 family metallophosphoesterase [Candidatus Hydrogenedentota bacterium]|nr:MAG: TIGR00282 family metallophosphoesterase [Candidatus Hydrogenedentota bacterium]
MIASAASAASRARKKPELTRVLFVGDVVGRPGRRALEELLPGVVERFEPELVIANIENAAGGRGLTARVFQEIEKSEVDVFTSGNHIWEKKDILEILERNIHVLKPVNSGRRTPGRGFGIFPGRNGRKIGVVNAMGRIFMDPNFVEGSPFDAVERTLEVIGAQTHVTVVDFHAEATSEKQALGWYLNGRVSAVVGTHTHVQTADEQILSQGTAYITDVGMTGPRDSVIGMSKKAVIERFMAGVPRRLDVARTGRLILSAVVVEVDYRTGRALSITRIQEVPQT